MFVAGVQGRKVEIVEGRRRSSSKHGSEFIVCVKAIGYCIDY
jgi:hypothetical protein